MRLGDGRINAQQEVDLLALLTHVLGSLSVATG
jgi:hypothetical protein